MTAHAGEDVIRNSVSMRMTSARMMFRLLALSAKKRVDTILCRRLVARWSMRLAAPVATEVCHC